MKRYRALYDTMLSSGELEDLMPHFTGDWGTDKKDFVQTQKDLEEMIYNLNVEIDNEEYYEDEDNKY